MKVVDIMTPNPHFVTPGMPLVAAAAIMRDHDVGAVPVVDDAAARHPVGIITDRDIAVRHVAGAHHHDCPCRDAMTAGPLETVAPTDDVAEACRHMRRAGVRRVLVTDANDRLVGIVATADLLRHTPTIGAERVLEVLEDIAASVGIER